MAIPSVPAAATPNPGAAAAGAPPEVAPLAPSRAKQKTAKAAGATAAASKGPGAAAASAKTAATSSPIIDAVVAPSPARPEFTALVRIATQLAAAVRGSSTAGWATPTTTSSSKASDLAFLKDPKLSIEDKLLKLLAYLNTQWDKELQDKMDKLAGKTTSTSTSSKTSSKSKGILGSIGSAFSSALGAAGGIVGILKIPAVKTALKNLGGPALAAAASALGFPQAAPTLLAHGPDVVNAALGIATAAGGSSKTSQATSSGGAALNDSERQSVMMEIQRIYDKQKEMFSLVSNILRASHDTRMTIIGNVR